MIFLYFNYDIYGKGLLNKEVETDLMFKKIIDIYTIKNYLKIDNLKNPY